MPDDYYFFRPPPDSFLFYGHQNGTRDDFFRGREIQTKDRSPYTTFWHCQETDTGSYVLLTDALLIGTSNIAINNLA